MNKLEFLKKLAILCILSLFVLVSKAQYLEPVHKENVEATKEYRICGIPKRKNDGTIHRSTTVIGAYRKLYPCPITGKTTGACPGWSINHVIPLVKGGCDSVINMHWVPVEIKSCKLDACIDRWERVYYGNPFGIVPKIENK